MHRPGTKAWAIAGLLLIFPAGGMADTYFEQATELLQEGRETDARRALELEIRAHPRNLEARYDLAVLLERIAHDEDAETLYRENLERGRHLPSLINLSSLLRRSDRTQEAEKLLNSATRDYPAEAVPWYLLGEMAEQAGGINKASGYYQKAIEADTKNGFAHLRYARFLSTHGQAKLAVSEADKAVALLPECAPCLKLAGNIHADAGRADDALALWQRSIAIEPDLKLRHRILQAMNPTSRARP